MVLLIWARLALFALGIVLLAAFFVTGRRRQTLLRLAGGCVLLGSLLTLVS